MDTIGNSQDEAISMAEAVRSADGRISYKQLWLAVKRGQIRAVQPYGKNGHYRIHHCDLERLLQPVNYQSAPKALPTAEQ